ncbi:hypothetical protein M413DRAFT_12137 [Hebeloma cylindrosporum]|uniref:Transmembrane protein n=1 Tax=Hebeloma cylindrosporum TaxID=76867 RepID=A0A0C3BS91_HEBCY|nr:hypothetical protein M413DRAFT_12137 [Hebeloma cylindrosporum h7]
MSRWVLVDDSDSGISYIGAGWFPDKGSLDSLGNFGPPYLSTLHGTQSDGSFSYTFTGTRVLITGTNQVSNSSGVTNPSFQCLVDGENVSTVTLSAPENRLLFCEKDGLSVGQHQISVAVTVSNQETFWFDYIQYLPTASVSLANAALSIGFTDSQIQYGSGWSSNNLGSSTSQNAATLSFQFIGISLTWLGYYANSQALLSTTATYSIDGQTPTSFSLRGGATGQLLNQIMFQTPQLSSGSHKLDIVYQGNSQSTPLTLNILIVQNDSSISSNSALPSSSGNQISGSQISSTTGTRASRVSSSFVTSPISAATAIPSGFSYTSDSTGGVFATGVASTGSSSAHNSSNLGPIIGGVVGGMVLLLLAIFGCLFLRRRRTKEDTNNIPEPMVVEPFNHPPTATISLMGSSKPPSTAGTSKFFVQHQHPGQFQVGSGHAGPGDPHSGSISSRDRGGGSSLQTIASHTRGTSSIDISSAERPMVQTRSNFDAPGIIRPQKELQLQSSASDDNPFIPLTRVIHEEDSGMRLPHADGYGNRVEVLPPRYTAG